MYKIEDEVKTNKQIIMSTLTMRSSPSPHAPQPSTSPFNRMLTTRSQSDILVPKPVKANLEFASPLKSHTSLFAINESRPLSRSTSAQTLESYLLHPQPQTPIRSTSSHGHFSGPLADAQSSSPERLAGIEIQNILFNQRGLIESSNTATVGPKSPAPMFKLVPTTPTVAKKNLNTFFESFKDASEATNEQTEDDEERPKLDRTTSFPSMTSSRDSSSFFHQDQDEDSYSEDCIDSDEEEDHYQEGTNFRMFGMYGSDDDEEPSAHYSHDGQLIFKSMTPPLRTENPLCFDDRFQHFSSTPVHEMKKMELGVELGLFKFSPIPSQN